jgi:hypothetical protein
MSKILKEEIDNFKRLIGKKSNLNEAASGGSVLALFLEKLKLVNLDEFYEKYLDRLLNKGAVDFDVTGKRITNINVDKLSDSDLTELFRTPPIRTAFEEAMSEKGYDIKNQALRRGLRNTSIGKSISAYDAASTKIISPNLLDKATTGIIKLTSMAGDKIADFFIANVQQSVLIRGIKTSIDDTALKNIETRVKDLTTRWEQGLNQQYIRNDNAYQKELYDILIEMNRLELATKKNVFENIKNALPTTVKAKLGDTSSLTNAQLEAFWNKLSNVDEEIKLMKQKYIGWFTGLQRLFYDKQNPGISNKLRRLANLYIAGEPRLRSEIAHNIRISGGIPGFIKADMIRRIIVGFGVYRFFYAATDYFEAYWKNKNGGVDPFVGFRTKGKFGFDLGVTFHPSTDWQGPKNLEDVDPLDILVSHMEISMKEYGISHNILQELVHSPMMNDIVNFFKDKENHKGKSYIETQAYQTARNSMLDSVMKTEGYIKSDTTQRRAILDSAEKIFGNKIDHDTLITNMNQDLLGDTKK